MRCKCGRLVDGNCDCGHALSYIRDRRYRREHPNHRPKINKPPLPIVGHVTKYGVVDIIRDITGYSEREAEIAMDCVAAAMRIWIEGTIRKLPPKTRATMTLGNVGTIEISRPHKYKFRFIPYRKSRIIKRKIGE